jgi:hypothetical protein
LRKEGGKLEGRGQTDIQNVNGVFCFVEGWQEQVFRSVCVVAGRCWRKLEGRGATGYVWRGVARLFDGCFYAAEGTTLVEEVYAGFS